MLTRELGGWKRASLRNAKSRGLGQGGRGQPPRAGSGQCLCPSPCTHTVPGSVLRDLIDHCCAPKPAFQQTGTQELPLLCPSQQGPSSLTSEEEAEFPWGLLQVISQAQGLWTPLPLAVLPAGAQGSSRAPLPLPGETGPWGHAEGCGPCLCQVLPA